jgi:hypothetical protein
MVQRGRFPPDRSSVQEFIAGRVAGLTRHAKFQKNPNECFVKFAPI